MSHTEQYNNQIRLFPFVLVFVEILVFLAMDMYLPALPSIARDFDVSQDVAQYTQAMWFLGSMSMQLILGPLAEAYGRKKVLLIGILVFIVTNIVLATTVNMNLFILARFLQGTTVCAVIVTGYATIHEMYTGKSAVQILAIMGSVNILAPALGPVLGALIITYSSWTNIFALLAVLGVMGFICVGYYMPGMTKEESTNSDSSNKLKAKQINFTQVLSEYRKIITNKRFMQSAFLYYFVVMCFFIWIVESPFIVINQYNKSELYFGFVQLAVFGGYICGAQTAKRLIAIFSSRSLSDLGLSFLGVAISSFLFFSYFEFNILLIVFCMVAVAFGASSLSGLMNRLAIESSDQPMTSRVAIYSLIISMSATTGSCIVTFVNDMTFDNIAALMAVCYICALLIYTKLRTQVALKED